MDLATRKSRFMAGFDLADKYDYEYVAVFIRVGDSKPEIIINHRDNFKSKREYYSKAYDEDLRLKSAKDVDINIVNYLFSDSIGNLFLDISENLEEC